MTKEGISRNPAPENSTAELIDALSFTTHLDDRALLSREGKIIHKFVRSAYVYDQMKQGLAAVSPALRRDMEDGIRDGKQLLGVSSRRNTHAFEEVVNRCAEKLEESGYPYYWFGETPKSAAAFTGGVLFDNSSSREQ